MNDMYKRSFHDTKSVIVLSDQGIDTFTPVCAQRGVHTMGSPHETTFPREFKICGIHVFRSVPVILGTFTVFVLFSSDNTNL